MADSVIVRADGTRETIPSKAVAVLAKGDRVAVKTAGGGGGVGDPRLRKREAVIADVGLHPTPLGKRGVLRRGR